MLNSGRWGGFICLLIINIFFPFKAMYRQLIRSNKFHLQISEPVVVAQAALNEEQGWGFFQFPRMCYTENGKILMKVANKPDSISTYSGEYLYYISDDQGGSWRACGEDDPTADLTLLMDNGCYFEGPQLEDAYAADMLNGAAPQYSSVDQKIELFDAEEISAIPAAFAATEYDPGSKEETAFEAKYSWDKRQLTIMNGLLLPSGQWLYHYKMHSPGSIVKEKDGSLFAAVYGYGEEIDNSGALCKFNVYFLRSPDCGRTWNCVSSIQSGGVCDESSDGLCEPCLTIAPDRRYVVLMRSGNGCPGYIAFSADKGGSWSRPNEFDDVGVDPQLLRLDCGVTLASYGRPGIYVRATDDPACAAWKTANRIQLSGENEESATAGSCCYTSLIKTGKYDALLAYSDFDYPSLTDPDVKAKTILVRKIHIDYNY